MNDKRAEPIEHPDEKHKVSFPDAHGNLSPSVEDDGPSYFKHKHKCTDCSMELVVLSDHRDWPRGAPTRNDAVSHRAFCPECGGIHCFKICSREVKGFIFNEH